MDKGRKDKQGTSSSVSTRTETKSREASGVDRRPIEEAGDSGIWIREDGAVCIGNECVSIKTGADHEMELTVDPDRCSCEIADKFLDIVSAGVLSGKGITITMKPRTKKPDQESHK